MDMIEKAKEIGRLLKLIESDKEHISRIRELNKYDHENNGGTYEQLCIKFCGRNSHTYLYIKDNDMGDSIQEFFTELLQSRIMKAEEELRGLMSH